MVVGGSRQETLDTGFVLLDTLQPGVPVVLRELVRPGGSDPVSTSFTLVADSIWSTNPNYLAWITVNKQLYILDDCFRSCPCFRRIQ
ncbi:unnamed protein product [Schistosoma mattheei]|uniref:Uncharacterized protein n=1 Tax=Schistosoma mattheei TaxID=31246 RepID=A0A183PAK9_9TREM|nr:unnamed protein product [Schistosoma mattheei]